jgi:hypothetical protein
MTTQIPIIQDEATEIPIRSVYRLDRGDAEVYNIDHIFEMDFQGEWCWEWDGGDFYARFETPRDDGLNPATNNRWCYVIVFADDSRGVCRVNTIEPALAALGARVDLSP